MANNEQGVGEVKRWNPRFSMAEHLCFCAEDPDGEYILFTDYAAKAGECERLKGNSFENVLLITSKREQEAVKRAETAESALVSKDAEIKRLRDALEEIENEAHAYEDIDDEGRPNLAMRIKAMSLPRGQPKPSHAECPTCGCNTLKC